MRKFSKVVLAAGVLGLMLTTSSYAQEKKEEAKPETGKDIALNVRKGNCLACHLMPGVPDAVSSATIGPPLIAMKARYPNIAVLRDKIWDASKSAPTTAMPPFGKHQILSDKEIDKIVEFVHGL